MKQHKIFEYPICFLRILMFLILPALFVSCKDDLGGCFRSTGEIEEKTVILSDDFKAVLLYDNIDVTFKKVSNPKDVKVVFRAGKNLLGRLTATEEFFQYSFPEETHNIILNENSTVFDTIVELIPEYEENRLIIRNENSCNFVRDYKKPIEATVYFYEINHIEYRSNGDITFEDPIKLESSHIIYVDDRPVIDSTMRFMMNIYEGSGNISLKVNDADQPIIKPSFCYLNYQYGTADVKFEGSAEVFFLYQVSFGKTDALDFLNDFVYIENRSPNDCYIHAMLGLGATINGTGNVYYMPEDSLKSITYSGTGPGQLIPIE